MQSSKSMPTLSAAAGGPVLVTGGAGFIGSATARDLLARGECVVVLDEVNDYYDVRLKEENLRSLRTTYPSQVLIVQGDICDDEVLQTAWEAKALGLGPCRRVVHLAARAGVRPSIDDPLVYVHSNIEATTKLLEMAAKEGCDSFVFASSSSVYGDSSAESFSETDQVDMPVSPYAATKKACELLAYTYYHLYNFPIAGLRFFTVYGPNGRPDMAPFKFVDRVFRGVEIQQYGDGTSSRDYTFIDDIVDGVIRSLDRPQGYQIYNLGNGSPIELKKFIDIVQDKVGKPANIRVLPMQPGDVPRTCANVNKAKELLGYAPKTSFEDGIAKTVAWYRDVYTPAMQKAVDEASSPETNKPRILPEQLARDEATEEPSSNTAAALVAPQGGWFKNKSGSTRHRRSLSVGAEPLSA